MISFFASTLVIEEKIAKGLNGVSFIRGKLVEAFPGPFPPKNISYYLKPC